MSRPAGTCPQCGAKIEFKWSGAVQTTCDFCQSILIRGDIDLQKVGTVADLPPDASPIQLGTEGIWMNRSFYVAGRIIYDHSLGSWNEWHLVFQDGTSGWLSDAQLEWAITFLHKENVPPSQAQRITIGTKFTMNGVEYEVTSRTMARYRGVEGELPFQYWNKNTVGFVDLRTQDARFATMDFSEMPGLIFLGQFVDFDQLQLKNLRQFEGWY